MVRVGDNTVFAVGVLSRLSLYSLSRCGNILSWEYSSERKARAREISALLHNSPDVGTRQFPVLMVWHSYAELY